MLETITNSISPRVITNICDKIDSGINPISIITQDFTDIALRNHFEIDHSTTTLSKQMTWKKFLPWFHSIANVVPFFSKFNKRVIIINTDLLTRVPNEKNQKQKDKKDSVNNFIRFIAISMTDPVILISEKPIKDYRFQAKPLILGNLIDYSDKLFIVDQIVNNPSVDETLFAIKKYGDYYDPLIPIIQNHLQKVGYDEKELTIKLRIYFNIRFEAKQDTVKQFIASSFKTNKRRKVRYPSFYFKMFKYSKVTSKLLSIV